MGEWVTGKGGKAASAKGGRCSAGLPPALAEALTGQLPHKQSVWEGRGKHCPMYEGKRGESVEGPVGTQERLGWGSGVTIMILPLCNSGTRTDPSLRERECGRAHHSLRALALQGTQWGGYVGGTDVYPGALICSAIGLAHYSGGPLACV